MKHFGPILVVLLLWGPRAGAEEDAAPLAVTTETAQSRLHLSFDVGEAITEGFRGRLRKGLRSRVRIAVRLKGRNQQASLERTCELTFDVWDEIVNVIVRTDDRTTTTQHRLFDTALADCTIFDSISMAWASDTAATAEVLVQLNPVSEAQKRQAREFLTNPRYNHALRSRSLVGNIASFIGIGQDDEANGFLFRTPLPLDGAAP